MDELLESRRFTTPTQFEMLLEFAETNPNLARGIRHTKAGRVYAVNLWSDIANKLNFEGPARKPKEWIKIWNDVKCRCRAKITAYNESGGNGVNITPYEQRVYNIIHQKQEPIFPVKIEQCAPMHPTSQEVTPQESEDISLESEDISLESEVVSQETQGISEESQDIPQESRDVQEEAHFLRYTQESQDPLHPSPQGFTQAPRLKIYRRSRECRRKHQAQASLTALRETRAMMLRIQETQAKNERLLAEAALRNAEAAKMLAEAAVTSALAYKLNVQTMATFTENLSLLTPAVLEHIETQMKSSPENKNNNK